MDAKVALVALAVGRYYTGGFVLPSALLAFGYFLAIRVNKVKETQRLQNTPRPMLGGARFGKKPLTAAEIEEEDERLVASRPMPNQGLTKRGGSALPNKKPLNQTLKDGIPEHETKPKYIRPINGDEVSVLSMTSNIRKKIPFHQHEEIVEILNTKLDTTIEEYNDMKSKLEAEKKKNIELQKVVDQKKDSNTPSFFGMGKSSSNTLETEIKTLNEKIRSKEAEILKIERRHENTKLTLETTTKKLEDLAKDKKEMMKSFKSKMQNYMTDQNRMRNTSGMDQSRISKMEKTILEKEIQLDSEQKKYELLSQELSIIKEKLTSEQEKNLDLKKMQVELREDFNSQERKSKALETRIDNNKKFEEESKVKCQELLEEQSKLKESLLSEKSKCMSLEHEQKKLSSLLEAEKMRVGIFERLVQQKDDNMSLEKDQMVELSTKVASLTRDLAEQTNLLSFEKDTSMVLEKSLNATEKELEMYKEKISSLEKEIRGLSNIEDDKAFEHKKQVETLQKNIDSSKIVNERLQEKVKLLEADRELNRKLEATKEKQAIIIEQKEEDLKSLLAAIHDQCLEFEDVTDEMTNVERAIEQIKITVNSDDFSKAAKQQLIRSYEQSLEEKSNKIEILEQSNTELSAENLTLQNSIKMLQATIKSTAVEVDSRETKIVNLVDAITSNEEMKGKEIKALEKRLEVSKNGYQKLQDSLSELEVAVKDQSAAFDAEHDKMQAKVKTAEQRVHILQTSLEGKLKMLSKAQHAMDVLEEELRETNNDYRRLGRERKIGVNMRNLMAQYNIGKDESLRAKILSIITPEEPNVGSQMKSNGEEMDETMPLDTNAARIREMFFATKAMGQNEETVSDIFSGTSGFSDLFNGSDDRKILDAVDRIIKDGSSSNVSNIPYSKLGRSLAQSVLAKKA